MHIHIHAHVQLLQLLIRLLPVFCLLMLGFRTALAAPITPPAGLVGWWTGDSNTVDLVNGNNATLLNGATYATGEVGAAFSFDGVNDYAEVAHNAAISFAAGSQVTIEFWLYRTKASLPLHFLGKRNGCSPGSINYQSAIDGSSPALPLNQWIHWTEVHSNATTTIYTNGTLYFYAGSGAGIGAPNAVPLEFAHSDNCSDTVKFGGLLDEICFYNRMLTTNEIAAIAAAGPDGKDKNAYLTTNTVWANAVSGDWNTPTNWIPNRVPRSFDTVYITNTGTFTVSISNAANANQLIMGLADTNATGIRTLNLAAGSLTVTNAAIETNGAVNFSGGTLTVRGLATAKGDFIWTAGTINGGGELQVGSAYGVTTISGAGAKH
jgi:hypothetical protein